MRKKVNRIPVSVFLDIVKEYDLNCDTMAAFHRCTNDVKGARIYIAKTKKVSRVHFAGFTLSNQPGLKQISAEEAKELRMGSVRGEIDFTEDEDVIIQIFNRACQAVKALNALDVRTIMLDLVDSKQNTTAKAVA